MPRRLLTGLNLNISFSKLSLSLNFLIFSVLNTSINTCDWAHPALSTSSTLFFPQSERYCWGKRKQSWRIPWGGRSWRWTVRLFWCGRCLCERRSLGLACSCSKYYSCLLSLQFYQIKFIYTITSWSDAFCRPTTLTRVSYAQPSADELCLSVCGYNLWVKRLS